MDRYEPDMVHILREQLILFSSMSDEYARDHGMGKPSERVAEAKRRLKELGEDVR